MNSKYKFYNNVIGWIVFAIAMITYALTIEPNASYWDCGEYIAVSANLEVGHAPGAAFFQLLGAALSTLSFGDPTRIPMLINLMSATASAFAILFLFWSITHLAQRLLQDEDKSELTLSQQIAIFGSGIVGALAFAFSDSFWFSAVEGEVYGMGSMMSALLFWLILKWENDDSDRSDRWIILISLIIGLAVGVHLMTILVIPAIGLIYYFKKYEGKITVKNFLIANVVIALVFGFIFKVIFSYTMRFFGWMEVTFANNLELGFNTGSYVALFLIITIIVSSLYYTSSKGFYYANKAILSATFMLIGFSSWLVLPIRANANPAINLNDPSDAIGMLDFYNRDQYGDWPVMYGPVFTVHKDGSDALKRDDNGNAIQTDKGPVYVKDEKNQRYKEVGRKTDYVYKSEYMKFFPRMYSEQSVDSYESYLGRELKEGETPTLGEEIQFFADYQLGQMYLRYLMWNFVGRQNDIPRDGKITCGNFISGIPFIDNWMWGDQSKMPVELQNNKAHNTYFFIPFIFAIIGLVLQFRNDPKRFYALLSIFLLTGVGILLYTNNKVFEPRERDYAYVTSFYVFAIWLGLAIAGLYKSVQKLENKNGAIMLTVLGLIAPVLMATQNWDDHDRSERYTAYDEAQNYLNSCKTNSILYVYGDNDTYPLWTVQEVQRFRPDLKILNQLLLGSYWHAKHAVRKTFDADAIPHCLPKEAYEKNMYETFVTLQDPDIPTMTAQEATTFLKDQFAGKNRQYLEALKAKTLEELEVKITQYDTLVSKYQEAFQNASEEEQQAIQKEAQVVMERSNRFNNMYYQLQGLDLTTTAVLPTNKIEIPVDKAQVLKDGIVSAKLADQIVDTVHLKLPITFSLDEENRQSRTMYKNDLITFDMIASNNWKRPIYFGSGATSDAAQVGFLMNYLQYNGTTYQLVPILTEKNEEGEHGCMDVDGLKKIFDNLKWGNLSDKDAYFDETCRTRNIIMFRSIATRLSKELSNQGRNAEAISVLDKLMKNVPYDYYERTLIYDVVDGYFKAGAFDKGMQYAKLYQKDLMHNYHFYSGLTAGLLDFSFTDARRNSGEIGNLIEILTEEDEFLRMGSLKTQNPGSQPMVQTNNTDIAQKRQQIKILIDKIEKTLKSDFDQIVGSGLDENLSKISTMTPAYNSYAKAIDSARSLSDSVIPEGLKKTIIDNKATADQFESLMGQVGQKLFSSQYNQMKLILLNYPFRSIIKYKEDTQDAAKLQNDKEFQKMKTLVMVNDVMQE